MHEFGRVVEGDTQAYNYDDREEHLYDLPIFICLSLDQLEVWFSLFGEVGIMVDVGALFSEFLILSQ